jgi:methylamine utilization protein MauE
VKHWTTSLSLVPSRKARWGLTAYGLVFLAQGLGKTLDPDGYLAALAAFHVLRPVAWWPLSLGALGLVWTVLELLAGVAMLYGGLGRAPAKELVLSGVMLALGLSCAYLALDIGALVRHLPIQNCTCFGTYLAQRLSKLVLLQETAVIALLTWLFASTSKWPSSNRGHAPSTTRHAHRRRPLASSFTAP